MKEMISDVNERIVLVLLICLSVSSCVDNTFTENDYHGDTSRTLLIYMAADNNLEIGSDVMEIKHVMRNKYMYQHYNVIIYADEKDRKPLLMRIGENGCDTIRVFDEQNSISASTLSSVITYTKDLFPAKSYGLVLWSHGSGWLSDRSYKDISVNPTQFFFHFLGTGISDLIETEKPDSIIMDPLTKGFGVDYSYFRDKWMSIDSLVCAIPDSLFDFIAFDACLMGCTEVCYALRNKAKNIIASPYEILIEGFPYHTMLPELLSGDLREACVDFFNYYNSDLHKQYDGSYLYSYNSGGIALINTSQLDSLARCFKKIVTGKESEIAEFDMINVQRYDREKDSNGRYFFRNRIFSDLYSFVCNLVDFEQETDVVERQAAKERLNEFYQQLNRTVIYKASTDKVLDVIDIEVFSGLSIYIPVAIYESLNLNDDYRKLEWSIDTGYGQLSD